LFRKNKRKRLASENEPDTTDNSGGDAQTSSEEEAKKENRVEVLPPPPAEGEMPSYFHVGLLAKMCLIHGYSNGLWKLQSTSKTDKDFFLSSFGEGYPTWNSVYGGYGGGDVIVNLGMIYHLEEEALIRAKINNVVELGLGYEQKLREGITASISAVLDCNNFKDGNHRLGVGVALQC